MLKKDEGEVWQFEGTKVRKYKLGGTVIKGAEVPRATR